MISDDYNLPSEIAKAQSCELDEKF